MSESKIGHTFSKYSKEKMSKAKLKWTEEQYQMMISLYQNGLSAAKVGKQINCDAKTVLNTLKRYGIKIRSSAETISIRQ